jgi:hypothetical protein
MERNGQFWQKQLERATGDRLYKKWLKSSKAIVRRFRNESFKGNSERNMELDSDSKGYNLLYRNVSVRLPFILPFIPKVQVERTNRDNDGVARIASMVLERIANKIVDVEDFKSALDGAKLDAELSNMGVIWVSYDPQDKNGLLKENIKFEFVEHSDFLWQKSKSWSDCEWVARRKRLTEDDFKKQYPNISPESVVRDSAYDKLEESNIVDCDDKIEQTISVYEIWHKKDKMVYIYQPTNETVLDCQPYPYDIDFPCAKPLSYDVFVDSTVPVSRHAQYLSQYKAIDSINKRISKLKELLRVCGAYDAEIPDFGKIFDADNDNSLVGLKNTEKYQGKDLGSMVWTYDPTPAVNALVQLKTTRDEYINDIQKGIGVYDVLEGETNAQEAYGTNRLKGSFGTMRMQDDQKDAIYFVQETIRIACDIICQIFEPLSIIQYSTIEYSMESLPAIEQAVMLLKDTLLKDVRLTISLEDVRSYYDSEYKANLSEMWSNVFTQLQSSMAMITNIPEMAGICKVALMSMIRSYKVGSFVEQEMEQAIDSAIQAYQNRPKDQPTPEMIKAQNEQAKLQLEQTKVQMQAQESAQRLQKDIANDGVKAQLENKRVEAETAKIISDRQVNEAKLQLMHREEDRKDRELEAETRLAIYQALHPQQKIDTNLGSLS